MTPDQPKSTPTPENAPEQVSSKKVRVSQRSTSNIVSYMVILFLTAFLLLVISYFMQQRQSDLEVITGLQNSGTSASQTIHNILERNQQLLDDNQLLREQLGVQQEAAQEQEQQLLAMDWLWRIQREYYRGRYSSARELIRAFESSGLVDDLSDQPLVDPSYRSPKEQFDAVRNALF